MKAKLCLIALVIENNQKMLNEWFEKFVTNSAAETVIET